MTAKCSTEAEGAQVESMYPEERKVRIAVFGVSPRRRSELNSTCVNWARHAHWHMVMYLTCTI